MISRRESLPKVVFGEVLGRRVRERFRVFGVVVGTSFTVPNNHQPGRANQAEFARVVARVELMPCINACDRQAHNLKVRGSNPLPATTSNIR